MRPTFNPDFSPWLSLAEFEILFDLERCDTGLHLCRTPDSMKLASWTKFDEQVTWPFLSRRFKFVIIPRRVMNLLEASSVIVVVLPQTGQEGLDHH